MSIILARWKNFKPCKSQETQKRPAAATRKCTIGCLQRHSTAVTRLTVQHSFLQMLQALSHSSNFETHSGLAHALSGSEPAQLTTCRLGIGPTRIHRNPSASVHVFEMCCRQAASSESRPLEATIASAASSQLRLETPAPGSRSVLLRMTVHLGG